VPVVIHDARLDRTTSGTGRVADHTLKALRRLDAGSWFNRRYPARARSRYVGRKIPLLEEVLSWVHDWKCFAFVEFKKSVRGYPGLEERVLEEIHRAGVASLATVVSFDLPTLRRLRRMDPRVSLGIDFTRPLLAVTRARRIKAGLCCPTGPLLLDAS
jgi:glycerophosphoryl diester phosphodiesterase